MKLRWRVTDEDWIVDERKMNGKRLKKKSNLTSMTPKSGRRLPN